jgi:hypothetical protein
MCPYFKGNIRKKNGFRYVAFIRFVVRNSPSPQEVNKTPLSTFSADFNQICSNFWMLPIVTVGASNAFLRFRFSQRRDAVA